MTNKQHLAAIDIGTNSFHMIIAEVDHSTGRFKVLDRQKEAVRLGSGSSDMKYLSQGAIAMGIETLKRFKAIADAKHSLIRAVATSAVREALNQDEFLRAVKVETGIPVQIISGIEEARLIYLGILQALPVYDKQILLIDVGGGSTEFLIGKERNVLLDNSLKMGAVRLTQRFFNKKNLSLNAVRQCREFVRGLMSPVTRVLKQKQYEMVIGTSGTILSVANMIRSSRSRKRTAARLNGFSFTRDELLATIETLLEAKDAKERAEIDGLEPKRADIIVAGALILEQIFKELKIAEMVVSECALREGVIYDTIEKHYNVNNQHQIDDIRYNSVVHLARQLNDEEHHSHHVANIALRIFDHTKSLHHLGDVERKYLEASALLHEVGLFLSHAQHHRHSYYIIRNADLLGFTENEKELIANVARYHRKSHPNEKHEPYRKMNPEDQLIVRKLAAILRIADGLDRTHAALVTDVKCRRTKKFLSIRLIRKPNTTIQLEVWGAERKKELFEEVFKKKVKFQVY